MTVTLVPSLPPTSDVPGNIGLFTLPVGVAG